MTEQDPELYEETECGHADPAQYDNLAVESLPFDITQFEEEDEDE